MYAAKKYWTAAVNRLPIEATLRAGGCWRENGLAQALPVLRRPGTMMG
jgi:hypothetical protein